MIDGNMEAASIKLWAEEDRPREKLLNKGTEALSNAELLAILIGSGSRKESAVDLCKRILESVDNSLDVLGRKTVLDYMQSTELARLRLLLLWLRWSLAGGGSFLRCRT